MARGRTIRAAVAALLLAPSLAVVTAAPAAAADDPWIDTSDRAAVLAAYRAEFDRTQPAMGYTGDTASCQAGTTSQEYRDSVVDRVNWYRRMAGLDTVAERGAYSAATQQTSTMMAAQGSLSHSPGSGWACHTDAGATAAGRSNLALGVSGVDAIDAYVRDSGAHNNAVGHRRTILYPQLLEVGSGDVPGGAGHWAANTLHVFDDNLWGARPSVREARGFVAWPPSGYVPAETMWGRWSFSLPQADFSSATVSVRDALGSVQVEVIDRIQASNPSSRIAPEASIVWAVAGDTSSALMPAPTDGDLCYDITVSGVRVASETQSPFSYTSCVIDPTLSPSSNTGGGSSEVPATCADLTFTAWTVPCWSPGGTLGDFTDVVAAWQREPVAWLVANEITTGVSPTRFAPDTGLTRAQAATMIWRLAGAPAPPVGSPEFVDVAAGAWYEDAVRWMAHHEITTGTGSGRFSPHATSTRAEFVTFLWRLVDRPAVNAALPFVDLSASWQQGAVRWAVDTEITTGLSATQFGPDQTVTRGQAAAFLARFGTALDG